MGVSSDVQIGNMALDFLGTRSTIASFQENSAEARALSAQYAPSLAAVLQASHWNFARKQGSLALLKDGTQTPSQNVPQPWTYEYAYPTDCNQARYILPPFQVTSPPPTYPPPRFLVSSDTDVNGQPNKVILTNLPQAILVYTAALDAPTLFDDQFVQAFAAYLAHRVCMRLVGDKAMAKMMFDLADKITRDARASNGNEGLTVIDGVPDWIRVRGYASDYGMSYGFRMDPQNLIMVT